MPWPFRIFIPVCMTISDLIFSGTACTTCWWNFLMVVGIQNGILNGWNWSFFSNKPFEKRPVMRWDHSGFRFVIRWPFRVSSFWERSQGTDGLYKRLRGNLQQLFAKVHEAARNTCDSEGNLWGFGVGSRTTRLCALFHHPLGNHMPTAHSAGILRCERCLLITESPKTPGHYRYLIWVLGYIPYMGLAVFSCAISRVPVYTAISIPCEFVFSTLQSRSCWQLTNFCLLRGLQG